MIYHDIPIIAIHNLYVHCILGEFPQAQPVTTSGSMGRSSGVAAGIGSKVAGQRCFGTQSWLLGGEENGELNMGKPDFRGFSGGLMGVSWD
jgi:hypothetical protein